MKRYIIYMLVSFVMMSYMTSAQAQSKDDRWHIRQGNRHFRQGRVDDAATEYLKAMEIDSLNPQAIYNRGRAILQKGNLQAADSLFLVATRLENNPIRKAMSWHNIGWTYQSQEKYQEAIEAYKEALRNNPHDEETRYNLALCQWQLKKQQNDNKDQQDQNNQQDNKDKNQDQDKQKDQDKDQQKKQNQDQNQDKDNANQDQDNHNQNQQGEGQQSQPQMSEQNMQRMLDAVNRKEQETQEKLGRAKSARRSRALDKNW